MQKDKPTNSVSPFGFPSEISKGILKDKFNEFINGTVIPNGCLIESMDICIKIPGTVITQKIEISNGSY